MVDFYPTFYARSSKGKSFAIKISSLEFETNIENTNVSEIENKHNDHFSELFKEI